LFYQFLCHRLPQEIITDRLLKEDKLHEMMKRSNVFDKHKHPKTVDHCLFPPCSTLVVADTCYDLKRLLQNLHKKEEKRSGGSTI